MKTSNFTYLLGLLLIGMSCKEEAPKEMGATIGSLYISDSIPSAGESLDIKYTPKTAEGDLSAHYYYVANGKFFPVDIDFAKEAESYNATIAIPDSASAIAFNFTNGTEKDSNDKKGYVFPLTDKNENIIAGAKAAAGMYKLQYGSNYGIEVDKATVLNSIKDDLSKNTAIQKYWDRSFPRSFKQVDKEGSKKYIEERIASYNAKESLTEDEYRTLGNLYQFNGQGNILDSLQNVIAEKYPQGEFAQQAVWSKFYKEKDASKQKEILTEFETDFGKDSRIRNMMLTRLAQAALKSNNTDEFTSLVTKVTDKSMLPGFYNNVAWDYAEKGENLDFAASISKKSLELVKSSMGNINNKPDYYSVSQYKKSQKNTYNMFADTYAFINFKQGNIDEAIKYQKEAVGEGKNPEYNARYMQFLVAGKKYPEILKEAGKYIKEGNSTSDINKYYKEAYVGVNGSEDGFKEDFAALEKVGHEKMLADIKKKMKNETPKNFALKNTDGKVVDLASLKGKTVVLDFWATWCGPCKASFPGMQMAVDKYKDDDSVVFLFIDTFEDGGFEKRSKMTMDFIKKNNYTFEVLIDNKIEDSSNYEVASNFGIEGIPTKVIIGPDGNIKFFTVGWPGSSDKMVKELSLKIDMLKS